MLAGRPSAVSVIAKTDCDTYEVSADALKKILREMPRLSDLLLRAFLMRRELIEELGLASVRVIGSRHSKETHRIREFLAKNKIPFSWIDLENDPQVDALLKNFKTEPNETPLVICGENRILRNPSNRRAGRLSRHQKTDRAHDLRFDHRRRRTSRTGGGCIWRVGRIENAHARSHGTGRASGKQFEDRELHGISHRPFRKRLGGAGRSSSREIRRDALHSRRSDRTWEATAVIMKCMLDRNEKLAAKCVLISSGAAYRKLNVKNNDRFEGTGVYYAATRVEAPFCKHAQVVVVGGGNSAGQAAIFLSDTAKKVFVVIRGDDLSKNMSHYLVCRIEETPNIEVRKRTEVTGMEGDKWLETVCLTNRETGQTEKLSCPAVFVFIGAVPHTKWLPSADQSR